MNSILLFMANERKLDMEVRRQELESAERARTEDNKIRREELKNMNMFMMQMICNNASVLSFVMFCSTYLLLEHVSSFLDSTLPVLVIIMIIDHKPEREDTTFVIMNVIIAIVVVHEPA